MSASLNGSGTEPVKKLKISEALSEFPASILQHAETLEHLDLSGTGLSTLPAEISQLKKLKIAFFSNCKFTIFPKELAACPELEMVAFRGNGMTTIPEDSFPPRLRWLILTNNKIAALPKTIGTCSRLQKCMLSGNELTALPEEMAACKKLGLLRLSANRLEQLPAWLFDLPELAFLSFAGNPCSSTGTVDKVAAPPDLAEVGWADLEVQQLLGEGASGIISKGIWSSGKGHKDVAIKLFKGDVTSDGTPMDEMRACITAGSHDNLINPLGRIHDHPEQKSGLVMQLIPPFYSTLGNPPSMQTCTRDTFDQERRLNIDQGLGILRSIASAAAHVHERGIAHGDLYAHNILFNEDGHALLGDFGAASLKSEFLCERLEVLAFAHLIEDIWGLVQFGFNETELITSMGLKSLHRACADRIPSKRPHFVEIVERLDATKALLESLRVRGDFAVGNVSELIVQA